MSKFAKNGHSRKCSVCGRLFWHVPRSGKVITDEDFICGEVCLKERNEAPLEMRAESFGGGLKKAMGVSRAHMGHGRDRD